MTLHPHRSAVARSVRTVVKLTVVVGVSVALVQVAVGRAQTPAREQRDQRVVVPTGTGGLAGMVIDADKNPVRRASVSIAGDMHVSLTTITDDAGRFLFTDLPAGRFTVTAEKGGYPTESYGAKRPNRPGAGILLSDGQSMKDVVLTLARGAVVTGTVFDEHGQLMPDVPVMAWLVRTSLAGDRSIAFGSQVVTSDDRGQYRIYGLPPGEYTVGTAWYFGATNDARVPTDAEIRDAFLAATKPGTLQTSASPTPPTPAAHYSYAATYIPSTADPLAAETLTLGPGDVREGVDLHMQFLPMSHIEGRVTGPDGSPAHNVGMVLFRRNRVGPRPTTHWGADANGRFTTSSLAPGDYSVMAQVNATPDAPLLWALADVTLSGPIPPMLSLRLQPGMTMTGKVAFEGASSQTPDPTKTRLQLLPLEGTSATLNSTTVKIDPTGAFSMTGLTPGRFVLMATMTGAPAWQVASLTIGGQDGMDLPIEIGTVDPPELIVTFTDRASDLSGVVFAPAGQAGSDFFVVALPADRAYWMPQSRRIRSTRPGTDGRYDFVGLPPGQYVLAATTDLAGGDLQDPGVLAELATHAFPVTLGAGETKTLDLKLGGGVLER
jgi:uncharacterized protein (DUF2141 family)